MLDWMAVAGKKEMENEQKVFAEYAEWVDDTTTQLGFDIKTAKSNIEELIAFINEADNTVARLDQNIKELESEIAAMEADQKDATKIRKTELAEYTTTHADYAESLDALEHAISELEAQNVDRPQAEQLLQRMVGVTPGMERVMAAFYQESAQDTTNSQQILRGRSQELEAAREELAAQDSGSGAPAVAAYEFQSQGIIDMLEKLETKFKDELDSIMTQEANKAHAYAMLMQHLDDTIKDYTAEKEQKSILKAKTQAASEEAKGKLQETKNELAAAEKLLAETKATFELKTAAYEENQKVRKGELEALAKAREIIASPDVAGSYSSNIKFVQAASNSGVFLQTKSASSRAVARQRASEFLKQRAQVLSSKALASLAQQLGESPFSKVVQMIEDLLARLKEEAAAEADHKAWCDEQLKNNKLKRDKKTTELNMLSAEIEESIGKIQTMADEIKELSARQAELTKTMDEATQLREKEHADNKQTIEDCDAAIPAVKKAMIILQEFYSAQAALIQQGQVPELEDYKGMQGASTGVIGMLEVIESDFSRLKSQTEADESQAAKEYKELMEVSKEEKEEKHKLEVKTALEKDQEEFELSQLKKDHEAVAEELAKANEYYAYLKPNCLEVHVSYEERVAMRKDEIEALKEAYGILNEKSGQ